MFSKKLSVKNLYHKTGLSTYLFVCLFKDQIFFMTSTLSQKCRGYLLSLTLSKPKTHCFKRFLDTISFISSPIIELLNYLPLYYTICKIKKNVPFFFEFDQAIFNCLFLWYYLNVY